MKFSWVMSTSVKKQTNKQQQQKKQMELDMKVAFGKCFKNSWNRQIQVLFSWTGKLMRMNSNLKKPLHKKQRGENASRFKENFVQHFRL